MSPASFYVLSNSILWTGVIGIALLALRRLGKYSLLFCGVALAVLVFAGRWPGLIYPFELNVDESQMIAQALKFRVAPVPWLHVDGTTSGPLNSYWLLPPSWLGIPLGYVSARMMGLVAVWVFLWFHFLTARAHLGTRNALLLLLPTVSFFALTRYSDFAHYSSEHLPMALLALEVYLSSCILEPQAFNRRREVMRERWMLACVAGAIPFAKLQAAPVAVAVFAVTISLDGVRWLRQRQEGPRRQPVRFLLPYVIGGLLPALCILGPVMIAGAFRDFWISYIVFGTHYGAGANRLAVLTRLITVDSVFSSLAGTMSGLALVFVAAALVRRPRPSRFPGQFGLLVLAFLSTTTLAILRAGQGFPHYLLLFPGPLFLVVVAGARAVDERLRSWIVVSGALMCCAAVMVSASLRQRPFQYWLSFAPLRRQAAPVSELGQRVLAAATPGDSMAVWGWEPRLYVETGLPPATRDAVTYGALISGPYQDYYLKRYVADIQRARPRFFVDAVQPGAFGFSDRQHYGHEQFAPLVEVLERNYRFAAELGKPGVGYRLYLLNESLGMSGKRRLVTPRWFGPDRQLRQRVLRQLHSDPITAHLSLDIAVSSGVAMVSGEIRNRVEQARALAIVGRTDGVIDVIDDLRISDDAIKQAVMDAFRADESVAQIPVTLTCVRGEVTLRSDQTNAEQRRRMVQRAASVDGVVHVIDAMK
jgi:osmotically-inducible protein OsmY